MLNDLTPREIFGFGLGTSVALLGGTAAMSYYATPENNYRVQGFFDKDGELPWLFGDLRVQVLLASIFGAPFMPWMVQGALGILGTSALFSIVSTEGQRWAESGEYFGISLPALPAMDESPAPAIAAPAADAAPQVGGMHYAGMHR